MTTNVLVNPSIEPGEFVANYFSLNGNPLFEAMKTQLKDPRLITSIKMLHTQYSTLTQGILIFKSKVPFEKCFEVREYGHLALTESGFMTGEVHLNLMFGENATLTVKYEGSHHNPESAKLIWTLDDVEYNDFEQFLTALNSATFAKEAFPKGFATHHGYKS